MAGIIYFSYSVVFLNYDLYKLLGSLDDCTSF
jgi:hypothetical protein